MPTPLISGSERGPYSGYVDFNEGAFRDLEFSFDSDNPCGCTMLLSAALGLSTLIR